MGYLHKMEIGDLTRNKEGWFNVVTWDVVDKIEKNYHHQVRFKSFENAQNFSIGIKILEQLKKLNDTKKVVGD